MVVTTPQLSLAAPGANAAQPKRRRPSITKDIAKKAATATTRKDTSNVTIMRKRHSSICEEDMKKYMQLFMGSETDESKVFVYFCTIGLLYYKFRREAPVEFTRFGGGNTGVGISSSRFDDSVLRRNAVSTARVITTWAERSRDGVLFFARVFYDADEAHKTTRDVHVKRIQDGMLHKSNLAGQRNKGMIDFDPETLKQSVYCCKSKCDKGFFLTFSLLLPESFEVALKRAAGGAESPSGVYSRLRVLAEFLRTNKSLHRNKGRVIYGCQEYEAFGHVCTNGGSPTLHAEKAPASAPKIVRNSSGPRPSLNLSMPTRCVVGSMPRSTVVVKTEDESGGSAASTPNMLHPGAILSSSLPAMSMPLWSNVGTPTGEPLTPLTPNGMTAGSSFLGNVFQFEDSHVTCDELFAELNAHRDGAGTSEVPIKAESMEDDESGVAHNIDIPGVGQPAAAPQCNQANDDGMLGSFDAPENESGATGSLMNVVNDDSEMVMWSRDAGAAINNVISIPNMHSAENSDAGDSAGNDTHGSPAPLSRCESFNVYEDACSGPYAIGQQCNEQLRQVQSHDYNFFEGSLDL